MNIKKIKDITLTNDECRELDRRFPYLLHSLEWNMIEKIKKAVREGNYLSEQSSTLDIINTVLINNKIFIIGKNQTNVRYLDPISAKIIKIMLDDVSKLEKTYLLSKSSQALINTAFRYLLYSSKTAHEINQILNIDK